MTNPVMDSIKEGLYRAQKSKEVKLLIIEYEDYIVDNHHELFSDSAFNLIIDLFSDERLYLKRQVGAFITYGITDLLIS